MQVEVGRLNGSKNSIHMIHVTMNFLLYKIIGSSILGASTLLNFYLTSSAAIDVLIKVLESLLSLSS